MKLFLPLLPLITLLTSAPNKAGGQPSHWAEIQVIDDQTGRGVPLVELETVNSMIFVTDNAGRVAFHEPGLMNRQIFFTVRSHGYEIPKDGFGFGGIRVMPKPGETSVIKIRRTQLAHRLCRLTGEGLYRDSILLGHKVPLTGNPGHVAGQDSVQTARMGSQILWLWGDTSRMEYPLGIFRMAGALTPVPDPDRPEQNPENGINFRYFTDPSGFVRNMMPLQERPEGVIWINAPCVVKGNSGEDVLVAHYSRRKGLADELEHGIALFNDDEKVFKVAKTLPPKETWRHPSGHPITVKKNGEDWILFGSPNPNVRVRASLKDIMNPSSYEAFSCAMPETHHDKPTPVIGADKAPHWRWQKEIPPTDSQMELRWIKEATMKPSQARFCPADMEQPADRIHLHSGTVRWNAYRNKWVLLACQAMGKASFLGEVWYSEADDPSGPFTKAVKVATHDKQSFYNVNHHDFYDRQSGRIIHFEGTYTNEFSGNPHKTPRYNYNQVLYRLDLNDLKLKTGR
ncbi:MAG: hypothetical protein ACKO9Z_10575 [Planctomycetota bacterium]